MRILYVVLPVIFAVAGMGSDLAKYLMEKYLTLFLALKNPLRSDFWGRFSSLRV